MVCHVGCIPVCGVLGQADKASQWTRESLFRSAGWYVPSSQGKSWDFLKWDWVSIWGKVCLSTSPNFVGSQSCINNAEIYILNAEIQSLHNHHPCPVKTSAHCDVCKPHMKDICMRELSSLVPLPNVDYVVNCITHSKKIPSMLFLILRIFFFFAPKVGY